VDGEAYLRRLGLQAPIATDLDGLRRLQRAHLEAIPFENSSVLRGEPIVLEEPPLVRKVVDEGRGGFCFELNGAFAWLLGVLGFEVALRRIGISHPFGVDRPWWRAGLEMTTTLTVALLSWRFIERPILRLRERIGAG